MERQILDAIGFGNPQIEPDPKPVVEQVVVQNEQIPNTIDNFGKILDQYEPA
ncbi:hypothetical protein ACN23B_27245 (plasmid) [Anabaena sp. FACHB-709]|uniref:Uncharacterized protein n=2 Tax=Nostocaceae TaxID=1162 RepID=A0A1Z4KUT8_ANAVA|nr:MULTISPECIES: hypothetical protein [Nostocaceae]BAY72749.1 hypothetical protein NIES23_55770 [Trichormus variabilis NIES-23]MBD2175281.1 hypothetical protein [Anabaena cylindrica FACHB-318]MBD2267178.1 hypothetical protein [Anabaena sp. FACHB-709]MBD2276745.1 hypothetical protein [Nostoc sp. PCC 7120 = FACHB-418]MBD2287325.1 hypothetical protein [Anabaena cylindrica FACHB-170]